MGFIPVDPNTWMAHMQSYFDINVYLGPLHVTEFLGILKFYFQKWLKMNEER